MLKVAYALGARSAFQKFALEPPSPSDEFVSNVVAGKDVPPTDAETPSSMTLPEDPKAAVGAVTSKIALGLKDMLFFEQQLGKDEAGKLFSDLQNQWQGKPGFARQGTLNIGPGGVQMQPFEHPLPPVPPKPMVAPRPAPTSAAPRAMPPPLPTALR
jgi:hypothetical protein